MVQWADDAGALRPIVLVPLGFLTSLPSAQVESDLLPARARNISAVHDFLFVLDSRPAIKKKTSCFYVQTRDRALFCRGL